MTAEELLKPRYLVIDKYPFSPFKVGEILTVGEDSGVVITQGLDEYPNLFRPLQWWENRDIKDMPEYVSHETHGTYILKRIEGNLAVIVDEKGISCHYFADKLEPATKQEFEDYTTNKLSEK